MNSYHKKDLKELNADLEQIQETLLFRFPVIADSSDIMMTPDIEENEVLKLMDIDFYLSKAQEVLDELIKEAK